MSGPRERFTASVSANEAKLNLAEAALLVAAEEYPQLTPEPYLQRLDLLAERVKDRLADEGAPPVVLNEISKLLFEEEGFRGNTEAYYDPRNSFLNDVLDRRLGIPLTLGIVFLEIGWRLGLPLRGVNFPGHFLLRYEGEAFRLLVDPFHGGQIRFEDQAQELLDRVYGGSVPMQPDYLRGASKPDILVRLLANLKTIYLNTRDDAKALAAIDRILLIRPEAADEIRDRGMVLARTGQIDEAIQALTRYLEIMPAAPDASRVKLLLEELTKS
ncbi:MAG TPA: transglutaminase-like domain-containing protein [Longimicrobiales bacterium]|nr:transglutaminase-like domain-containing protein [Longimicrobiales bacterium]